MSPAGSRLRQVLAVGDHAVAVERAHQRRPGRRRPPPARRRPAAASAARPSGHRQRRARAAATGCRPACPRARPGRAARPARWAPPGSRSSSSSIRFSSARNSSLRNSSLMPERSGGSATSEPKSTSIGSSRSMVASCLLRTASSAVVASVWRRFSPATSSRCCVDALDAAELHQQVGGGLLADAGHALDVVGAVALEADEVGDLLGADAVALADPLGRVDDHVRDAARRHHDADVVGGQLERVTVGGDDADAVAGRARPSPTACRSRRRPPSPRRGCCGSRTPPPAARR